MLDGARLKRTVTTMIVWAVFVGALVILGRQSRFALGGLTGLGVAFMLVIVITRIASKRTAARIWPAVFAIPLLAPIGLVDSAELAEGVFAGGAVIPLILGVAWLRRRGQTRA